MRPVGVNLANCFLPYQILTDNYRSGFQRTHPGSSDVLTNDLVSRKMSDSSGFHLSVIWWNSPVCMASVITLMFLCQFASLRLRWRPRFLTNRLTGAIGCVKSGGAGSSLERENFQEQTGTYFDLNVFERLACELPAHLDQKLSQRPNRLPLNVIPSP